MDKKKVVKCVFNPDGTLGMKAMGLVEHPAIEENWTYLNKIKLSAVNEEKRLLYGLALVPDKLILRVDEKTLEEYYITFDKETVRQCAFQWVQAGLQNAYTIHHEKAINGCSTVESWIVEDAKNDKVNALGLTAIEGAWALGTYVADDSVWADVKAGKVKGYSIEGLFLETALGSHSLSNLDAFFAELQTVLKNFSTELGNN